MKRGVCIFLLCVLAYGAAVFIGQDSIVHNFYLPVWPEMQATELLPEIQQQAQKVLDQPFHYLGKGRQFYVYESQDHKWVLKFIKCQRFTEWYDEYTGLEWLGYFRSTRREEKSARCAALFSSIQLAAGPLSDVTGTLACHLIQRPEFSTTAILYDPAGVKDAVFLDDVPFVIQRKAMGVFAVLDELYAKCDMNGLKMRLQQLVFLYKDLAHRGYIDIDDGAITRGNIGFLEDRAVCIDIGTLQRAHNAEERLPRDLKRLTPVFEWLQGRNPTLATWFSEELQ